MKVQVTNLRKEFGRTVAVNNISFAFDSGHVFGFVGPNGAGKTTTMRIIASIEEPTSGDVLLNGVSVCEEPELARHCVGYVPDTLPAHGDITVHEYLDFFARAYGLRGKKRTQAVEAIEEFTNVTGIRDKHLKALSKGMKQRVSLGRALVYDPDVLVLDEPAAGLDPRARVLTELTEICNGVVIIERGKILETGTIDEVLKKSTPRRTVAVRLLDIHRHQHPQLLKELLQTPLVEIARDVANEIHFELAGDESAASDVLGALVAKQFKVVEFRQTKANLEDIFMNVTKGGVQ
jgi:ABC-2 type transport system ATP-binding protein